MSKNDKSKIFFARRKIAWLNIFFQLLYPLSLSFTPAMAASLSHNRTQAPNINLDETMAYTLRPGETTILIAKKYHLTLGELKKINQFRTFSRPFSQLSAGEEIDVPAAKTPSRYTNATTNKKDDLVQTNEVSSWLAGNSRSLATSLQNGSGSDYALSQASSQGEEAVQKWLEQFGTAKVQLNMNKDFSIYGSAVDLLVPLYDNKTLMLFSQLGARHKDHRNTLNTGVGVRVFQGKWMYGGNTFFDNDITGNNHRVGIGGEAWTDYLRLSANGYIRTSNWHQSKDLADYDERPANGFDVIANFWSPQLPQLGGKLKYEKYYGNEVALFGPDADFQNNPSAFTVGVNYTPVPLVTLGSDYKIGRNGLDELQFGVQFKYDIGRSLSSQIDPAQVAFSRTLANSKTDLVERNNDIVLEYLKQELVRLTLPASIQGRGLSTQPVGVSVSAKYGVARINLDASTFEAAGGTLVANGQGWVAQLPSYQAGGINSYLVRAIAYDNKGNASEPAHMQITVVDSGVDKTKSQFKSSSSSMESDGRSQLTLTLDLVDSNNQPVTGLANAITLPFTFTPDATALSGKQSSWMEQARDAFSDALISRAIAADRVPPINGGVSIRSVTEVRAGVYEATMTAGKLAGVVSITPLVEGVPFIPLLIKLTQDAPALPSAANSTLTASPDTVTQGENSTITLVLQNTLHEPVTGQAGLKLTTTDSSGEVLLTESSTPGTYSAQVSPEVQGTQTWSVFGLANFSKSVEITVNAALPSAANSTLTASPDTVTQGENSTITLVLQNTLHEPVTGQAGLKLTTTDSSGEVLLTESSTPGTYSAQVSPEVQGTQTWSVFGLANFSKSVEITVNAALPSAANSTLTASPDTVTQGENRVLSR